jgi:G:T-mismatch repair DNA endonuclease (very short patch repair protein)
MVFVHACFGHGHSDSTYPLAKQPKTRLQFWLPRLEGSALRDPEVQRILAVNGRKNCTTRGFPLWDMAALRDMFLGFANEID